MYASVASPRCLSAAPVVHLSPADPRADGRRRRYGSPLPHLPPRAAASAGVRSYGGRRIAFRRPPLLPIPRRTGSGSVFCMAPDEEKMTRRSPLDFPIEWERPKPGRRPDIFPQFSPMKTPLPPPLPADPPEEDEEEEEKKEEEEDPETEEPEKPEQRQKRAEWWWS